jgi:hypothetical protein
MRYMYGPKMAYVQARSDLCALFQVNAVGKPDSGGQYKVNGIEQYRCWPSGIAVSLASEPASKTVHKQGLQAEVFNREPQPVSRTWCSIPAMEAHDIRLDVAEQLAAPSGRDALLAIERGLFAEHRVVESTEYQPGRVALHDYAGRNAFRERSSRQQRDAVADSDRPVYHAISTNPHVASDLRQAAIGKAHADCRARPDNRATANPLCAEYDASMVCKTHSALNLAVPKDVAFRKDLDSPFEQAQRHTDES